MPRSPDLDTIAPDDKVDSPAPKVTVSSPDIPIPSTPVPVTDVHPAPKSHLKPNYFDTPGFHKKVYDILGHTKTPFSSFLVRPDIFTFSEKDDDEEILLVLRPHWFTNVGWIIIATLMLFVPLLLPYVPLLNNFPPNYQFVAVIFWYLITFAYAFEQFLSWYFDVYIITTQRVVDIEFNNLLDKKFSEAGLGAIQDVTSRVSGVSQTMFNYGTVLIQTAAEVNQINFEKVPNPDKIVKILGELRETDQPSLNQHVS